MALRHIRVERRDIDEDNPERIADHAVRGTARISGDRSAVAADRWWPLGAACRRQWGPSSGLLAARHNDVLDVGHVAIGRQDGVIDRGAVLAGVQVRRVPIPPVVFGSGLFEGVVVFGGFTE